MKLTELFMTPDELRYKDTGKQPISSKQRELSWTDQSRKKIGGGAYADAYAADKDPGAIDKIAKPNLIKSLSRDAYYQYLDTIAHNERISNNPFFPKIYNLQTYRDQDGKYTYKVNMEKLRKLDSLSFEEATRIGRELFADYDIMYKKERKGYGLKGSKPTGNKEDDELKKEADAKLNHLMAIMALADCFNEALMQDGPITNITNSHLNQAILLIRKILKSNKNFSPDLHHGNLMIRRGPFTPQVVITDPISGGESTPRW